MLTVRGGEQREREKGGDERRDKGETEKAKIGVRTSPKVLAPATGKIQSLGQRTLGEGRWGDHGEVGFEPVEFERTHTFLRSIE